MQQTHLSCAVTLTIARTTLILPRKLLQFPDCHFKAAKSTFSPHY